MNAIGFSFNAETKETSIKLRIPNWFPLIFGHYNKTYVGREDDDKVWQWKTQTKQKPVTDRALIAHLDYARKLYWKECGLS